MANPSFPYARFTYAPIGEKNFRPLDEDIARRVTNLIVTMAEGALPVVQITFRNTDLVLMDHPIISNYTQVTIRIIRDGVESPRIIGIVQKVSGSWLLTVEITDLVLQGHFVPDDSDIQTDGKSRKDIIEELLNQLGFSESAIQVKASEEKKVEGIKFDTTKTIWANIQDQAKEEKAQVIIIGRERIVFSKRNFSKGHADVVQIEPGAGPDETDVKRWSIDNDLLDKRGEVIMKGINLLTKKEITVKKNRTNTDRDGLGTLTELFEKGAQADIAKTEAERVSGPAPTVEVDPNAGTRGIAFKTSGKTGTSQTVRTSAQSEETAKNEAEGNFKEKEDRQVVMTLVTRVRPKFVPGLIILVLGIGKKFSGKWYLAKVKHNIPGQASETESTLYKNLVESTPANVLVDSGAASTNKQKGTPDGKLNEAVSVTADADTGRKIVTYKRN